MFKIPDILNKSLRNLAESSSSSRVISGSFHSHSNNNREKLESQLSDKQINCCNEFLRDNLSPCQFRVFQALMELHLKYNGNLYPSLDLLADMAGCARSTVQLAIKRLKELNIIDTHYRGYHQTLIYRIHEFYITNKSKIASLVKNVAMISLLLLSTPAALSAHRYLLKEKDVYFRLISKNKGGNVALDLTKENYQEMRKHPDYIFDRTLKLFEKKMAEGVPIANHTGYFMGIFKQEVAKSSAAPASTNRQFKTKDPQTGTTKPYVRPKTGPYAEFIPEPKRVLESDFDITVKLEMRLHTAPNMFLKEVADRHLLKLSKEERNAIMMIAHKDCECRPNLGIED